jgi:hypothetical protein
MAINFNSADRKPYRHMISAEGLTHMCPIYVLHQRVGPEHTYVNLLLILLSILLYLNGPTQTKLHKTYMLNIYMTNHHTYKLAKTMGWSRKNVMTGNTYTRRDR